MKMNDEQFVIVMVALFVGLVLALYTDDTGA